MDCNPILTLLLILAFGLGTVSTGQIQTSTKLNLAYQAQDIFREKPTAPQSIQGRTNKPLTSREIVNTVSRSLVLIVTQDKEGEPIAQGSGFVFRDDLVATNLHVFKRASQGYIKLISEGLTYKITEIVGIDMPHDLCVFRVAGISALSLTLASLNSIAVGDEVYVGGNPKGLEGSFSRGIISSIRLEQGVIQIDAAISSGSSGGPVVNNRAEVIGIATSILPGGQNLNFAIPVSYLAALRYEWKVPVFVAGALSLTDRDKEKLKGPLRSIITRIADYGYDERTDRYFEKPAETDSVTTYDYVGNETAITTYRDGSVIMSGKFEYNGAGLKTRTIGKDKDGSESVTVLTETEGINDKINNRQFSTTDEMKLVDPKTGKEFVFSVKTYDRFGNKTEETINGKEGPNKYVRTYDKNGYETEQRVYKAGKLDISFRYTYEFDQWGNWIVRYETFYNSKYPQLGYKPSGITYREIKYYADR